MEARGVHSDNKCEIENLSMKCYKLMKLVEKCEKYFKDKLFSEESLSMENVVNKEHEERPCIVSGACETKWKYGSTLFRHMVEHHSITEEEANISIVDYFKSTGEETKAKRWGNKAENSPAVSARKKLNLENQPQNQKRIHSSDEEDEEEDNTKKAREVSPDHGENYKREVEDVTDFLKSPEKQVPEDVNKDDSCERLESLLEEIQDTLNESQKIIDEAQEMDTDNGGEPSKNDPLIIQRLAEARAAREAENQGEADRQKMQESYMEMQDNYIRISNEMDLTKADNKTKERLAVNLTFQLNAKIGELKQCREANKNLLEDVKQLKENEALLRNKIVELRAERDNAAAAAANKTGSMDWRVKNLNLKVNLKEEEISNLKNRIKTLETEVLKATKANNDTSRKVQQLAEEKREAEEYAEKASKSDKEAIENLEAFNKQSDELKKELVKYQKKHRCNDKKCTNEEACDKSHAFKEKEARTLCNMFKKGACKFGDSCKFMHDEKARETEL